MWCGGGMYLQQGGGSRTGSRSAVLWALSQRGAGRELTQREQWEQREGTRFVRARGAVISASRRDFPFA